MSDWDYSTDFLIIGSGGGGLSAAIAARTRGADALVLEKQATIGGNTGLSGGTMWVPDNPFMRAAGIVDSAEAGVTYLNAVVGEPSPASSPARKQTYVTELKRLLNFLSDSGMPFHHVEYPDYYDQAPGGNPRGRIVQTEFFDLSELGPWQDRVLNPPAPYIASVREAPEMTMALRSRRAFVTLTRVFARTAWVRLRGRPLAANGAALIGRLLQLALRGGADIWTESPVEDLIVEDNRVVGVRARRRGREVTIQARRGVLIASGGFARNAEMRERFSRTPTSQDWTLANPGETGEVVLAAKRIGAATDLMDEGIWIPITMMPEGPFYNVYERAQPHAIIVNGDAQRFVDEASTYLDVVQAMYREHERTSHGIPAWVIIDSQHRRHYPWGLQLPGRTPKAWIDSGYMKRAGTLEELAHACGLDARVLQETVTRFNRFAASGVDEDFGRAQSVYGRFFGDPRNKPNPGLGPIDTPPFYAVQLYPGDLGTFGGIITDEHARVLRADGSVIEGLYATGTATAPVTGRVYPGTGNSIGGTMVWGFVAAQHALGRIAVEA